MQQEKPSRLRAMDDLVQRASGHITVWPVVAAVLTAVVAVIAVALAYLTKAVHAFAPLSYLFAALLAALVAIGLLWTATAFYRWARGPLPEDFRRDGSGTSDNEILKQVDSRLVGMQGGMASAWTEINNIKSQIAVDWPNSKTVAEAFSNLAQAMRNRADRTDESVEPIARTVKLLGQDVTHLLTTTCAIATATALENLNATLPQITNGADISDKAMQPLTQYIGAAEVTLTQLGRSNEFRIVMKNAEALADERLANLPTPHYPSGMTPANFRKRMIIREQYGALWHYTERELGSVLEAIVHSRTRAIEAITRGENRN